MASLGAAKSGEPGVVAHITLERLEKGNWEAVNSHLMLRGGEQARFVFRSNTAGYLYVVGCEAKDRCRWLFAAEGKPVEVGKEYTIPADGFKVPLEPGYDTTYWILSPEALARKTTPGAPGPVGDKTPALPHCRHIPLMKRGVCQAPEAGAHPVEPITPQWFEKSAAIKSEYVNIDDTKPDMRILMSSDFDQPLVFSIRIAHE